MIRKILLGVIGVVIIAGAVYFARQMVASKQGFRPQQQKAITSVLVQEVRNGSSEIRIVTSGQLVAKRRVELYSEARGVLQPTSRDFRPGVKYSEGELIFEIENAQELASLQAQKSSLFNQIVALLPDLRLDYPESFEPWNEYVQNFSFEGAVKPLPEPVSEREKLFLAGRNIYTTYFNTVTMETSLKDFRIYSPFNGVVTEALVQSGTMVSPGQKLGAMIDQSVYELEAAVNVKYLDLLRVGKPVELSNITHSATFTGKVVRVDGRVDRSTQTITVYIEVRSLKLKEGMYLEAQIAGQEEENTFELSRKLLVNETQVFTVQDTVLRLKNVEPVYFKENSVVVRGLEDGTRLLAQPVPGAYPGMLVQVVNSEPIEAE